MVGYMLIAQKFEVGTDKETSFPHGGRGRLLINDEFEGTEEGRRMAMKYFMSIVEGTVFTAQEVSVSLYAPDYTEIAHADIGLIRDYGYCVSVMDDGYLEISTTTKSFVDTQRRWVEENNAIFSFVSNPNYVDIDDEEDD